MASALKFRDMKVDRGEAGGGGPSPKGATGDDGLPQGGHRTPRLAAGSTATTYCGDATRRLNQLYEDFSNLLHSCAYFDRPRLDENRKCHSSARIALIRAN